MPDAPAPRLPRAGDVVFLTRAASVQFVQPIRVRVIRRLDVPTYDGWCWIDCYQLSAAGDAIARRSLYVQPAGVEYLLPPPRPATARRALAARSNTRPATTAGAYHKPNKVTGARPTG